MQALNLHNVLLLPVLHATHTHALRATSQYGSPLHFAPYVAIASTHQFGPGGCASVPVRQKQIPLKQSPCPLQSFRSPLHVSRPGLRQRRSSFGQSKLSARSARNQRAKGVTICFSSARELGSIQPACKRESCPMCTGHCCHCTCRSRTHRTLVAWPAIDQEFAAGRARHVGAHCEALQRLEASRKSRLSALLRVDLCGRACL